MATKKKASKKKPAKKTVPPKDVWTQARVSALYKMDANTPRVSKLPNGNGSTHQGEPHEWEWEKEPTMAPICLGCNATGDYVERVERGDEPLSDEELLDDGFGDDFLDDRYF